MHYNSAMCGFAGEFVFAPAGRGEGALAEAMAAKVAHRGPDDAQTYTSVDGRCAIGFRRLAVIDRAGSRQPMALADGSAMVAFNGEIYNFRALRQELAAAGYQFRTQGDTEVLLAMWARHGPDMLPRLEGMFAFAIHDVAKGRLFLARDRLGVKPLWYAALADRVVFGSEAKAVRAHPGVGAAVDPSAIGAYLVLGYVPAPRSVWQGIVKLLPGHSLLVGGAPAQPQRYWSPPEQTAEMPKAEAVALVREKVTAAVEQRLVADVPLGALLSGGIDSSIVAALMCRLAGKGVKTFCAGFAQGGFDERPFAAEVARHIGSDHRELLVSAADAAGLLGMLVSQYDEPFADSSALPTYSVCRAAREHVTVALTGDGGDEAFAGYDRYRALCLAENMGPTAWALTKLAAAAVRPFAPPGERSRLRRLVRFAAALDDPPARQYLAYRRLFTADQLGYLLKPDFAAAADIDATEEWFCDLYEHGEYDDEAAFAQRHDLLTYLGDDLLVKADIASMASALELRSPLLDHTVVELGLSLPADLKISAGHGKAILRDAFGDLLPEQVFTRPKTGFGANCWAR
jgi:asparagine synthase (glutamine-hydrolysing)